MAFFKGDIYSQVLGMNTTYISFIQKTFLMAIFPKLYTFSTALAITAPPGAA